VLVTGWQRACRAAVGIAAAMIVGLAVCGGAAAAKGPAVEMRVLLLSATGVEPTFEAWRTTLEQDGVPFDAVVRSQSGPITAGSLRNGARGRYQAVILATGELSYFGGSAFVSALSPDEWTALREYERTFGVRELDAYVYPSPAYGLNYPNWASPDAGGSQAGVIASLTNAGRSAFPYLAGRIEYDDAWGYHATPADPLRFTTLVAGPDGSALAGVYRAADGREQLVSTVDANAYMLQHELLAQGMLSWVTRGTYLGYARNYLGLEIDDTFIADDRWDMSTNTTPEDDDSRVILMTAADVSRALSWERKNGLRLDLVFNGDGADGIDGGLRPHKKVNRKHATELTQALLKAKDKFGWINHTWDHQNFDWLDYPTLVSEIADNQAFARRQRLPFDPSELVTGEHAGFSNPSLPFALQQTGIQWIASDASRTPEQTLYGPALTVPRYPTNVYYNVGTVAEQLDEYNYVYFEHCTNSPTNTCLTQPATWSQYVTSEVGIMFRHVLGNDPRPHYFHQSNLAEDGVLYPVIDALLAKYRTYFNLPVVQPTLGRAGAVLAQQRRWRETLAFGRLTAYIQDGRVYLQGDAMTEAPITGSSFGDSYGGTRSGWISLPGSGLADLKSRP
jgi:hypothetical protein